MKQRIKALNLILLALDNIDARQKYLEGLGNEFFLLKSSEDVFFDERDFTFYSIVKIGNASWIGENFHYDAGENCSTIGDTPEHLSQFGRLYTYESATQACPEGWRIPDMKAWNDMLNDIGGYYDCYRDEFIGIKDIEAKEKFLSNGEDLLNIQLGGYMTKHGSKKEFNESGYYLSSFLTQISKSSDSDGLIYIISAESDSDDILANIYPKNYGSFSCRYVKEIDMRYYVQKNNQQLLSIADISQRELFINRNSELKGHISSGAIFHDNRDNTLYSLKKFGNQTWLGENLRYKIDFGCLPYHNDELNASKSGRLYTAAASQLACPEGFHIPSIDEWMELFASVGGICNNNSIENPREVIFQLIQGGYSGFDAEFVGCFIGDAFTDNNEVYYMTSSVDTKRNKNYSILLDFPKSIGVDVLIENMAVSCRCIKNSN